MTEPLDLKAFVLNKYQEGKIATDIVKEAIELGYKTRLGTKVSRNVVSIIISRACKNKEIKPQLKEKRTYQKKIPSMQSIPIAEEKPKGKVIALIGNAEDIQEAIRGYMHG